MSYTQGNQTINKSMNGLQVFDNGDGIVLEGDTIITVGLEATNIECQTLKVYLTSTFNNSLPTSTQTTSNDLTQLINRSIGNSVYPQLGTTNTFTGDLTFEGNNTFDGSNTFNDFLPTSSQTTSNALTQLINRTIGNTYYARLNSDNTFTSNSNNTFKGAQTFQGTNTFDVALPTSSQTTSNALTQLINRTIGNTYYARLNSDNTFTSNSNNTFKGAQTFQGTNTFDVALPTSTQTTSNALTQLINRNIGNSVYPQLSQANAFLRANTFDNFLPTSILTTSDDLSQLINRNIGNAVYPQLSQPNTFSGDLTFDGSNTFTSNNTFSGNNNYSGYNEFRNILPSTDITSTAESDIYSFINMGIANLYYPKLSTGNTFSGLNLFEVLPYSALTTTTNNKEFINKNIGNAVYPQLGSSNTFTTGINEFQGTNHKVTSSVACELDSPTVNIDGVNCNLRPTSSFNITSPTTNINGTNLNINSTNLLDVEPTTIFRKNVTLNNLVYMSATQTQYIAGGGASPSGVMTINAEANLQLNVGNVNCLWMNNTGIPYISQYPPTSLDHVVTKRFVDQEIAPTVKFTASSNTGGQQQISMYGADNHFTIDTKNNNAFRFFNKSTSSAGFIFYPSSTLSADFQIKSDTGIFNSGSNNFSGLTTFTTTPIITSSIINNTDACTKGYVDQEIATVTPSTQNPVVIGVNSTGISGSIAIGQSADVLTGSTNGIAIGNDSLISGNKANCVALGRNARCDQSESTAIGYNAVTNGVNQICLGQSNGTVRCGRITPMYPVANPIFSSGQIGFITKVNATAGNLTSTSYTDICNAGIFPYGVYSITVFVDIHSINSIANFVSYSLQTVTTNTILQESNLSLASATRPNQSSFTYYYEAYQGVKLSLKINNGTAAFSSHTNISLVRIA